MPAGYARERSTARNGADCPLAPSDRGQPRWPQSPSQGILGSGLCARSSRRIVGARHRSTLYSLVLLPAVRASRTRTRSQRSPRQELHGGLKHQARGNRRLPRCETETPVGRRRFERTCEAVFLNGALNSISAQGNWLGAGRSGNVEARLLLGHRQCC